ncbi:phosphogluconate dehydratase [Ferrimonas aestuarii]|uniref:Phosphogluconate dehydratase n=1 Tax=Ferrimonas aestuarii TaxID=2569539 RepID=A0A4U1BPD7_9GAMM|nr:phosphogluconate dehydratase [Ferrimonas aestuarii]TKB51988.1 phosphogluconate dehydratase [Ferrimonas aestuarii]
MTHATITAVTERIVQRSQARRQAYLARMLKQQEKGVQREALSCSNLAHGFASCGKQEKDTLSHFNKSNIAITTAYNDMLSAHQPYGVYPDIIKEACREVGSVAQVAGGVPAMCDGVTQGQPGMELSLMSRDVIAMATSVGLSHAMFDGSLMLGICDKIVPGLLMGAMSFGYLPTLFVPAGPMPSGLPNKEKAKVRQEYAQGKVSDDDLLKAESASYHSPGTCTFYGTANSNQLVLEAMGLQLPGSSFVNPTSPLRLALTKLASQQVCRMAQPGDGFTPLYKIVDEKSVVNGIVALLATGGSTNLTMHIVAAARAAGIIVDWQDFAELSAVTPLLARVYPNGQADINHFHQAGGMAFLIRELRRGGLLHDDVHTAAGYGLERYTEKPELVDGKVVWNPIPEASGDDEILRPVDRPFLPNGGMNLVKGNLGRAVIKTSAVAEEHQVIEAPAKIFESQAALTKAFQDGELNQDFVAIVRYQGPQANGMPELHKLLPPLGVLQDQGFKVALVTDGRMSGASGKVPAAIHVSPEALDGGLLAKVKEGDLVRLDAKTGILELLVDEVEIESRTVPEKDLRDNDEGLGRELFKNMRKLLSSPETGASALLD